MKSSNLLFYLVIAALVAVIGAGPLMERKIFTSTFEVEEIADNVYVGIEMSPQDRHRFLQNYTKARQKVAAFFGRASGHPRVIACSTWDCYERIGGPRPGNGQIQHGAAYGQRFFQISPASLGDLTTVIHEYTHIEIAYRLGRRGKFGVLPVWFNEGLAVVVSDDPKHSEDAYKKLLAKGPPPDMRKLSTPAQWAAVRGSIRDYYTAAAHEVRKWMKQAGGAPAVVELLARLKEGEDFETVYNALLKRSGGMRTGI